MCALSWANKHALKSPSGPKDLGNESVFSLERLGQMLMDCMAMG